MKHETNHPGDEYPKGKKMICEHKEIMEDLKILVPMAIGIAGIFFFIGVYWATRAPDVWFVRWWADVLCIVSAALAAFAGIYAINKFINLFMEDK